MATHMLHSCLRVLADGWKFAQKTLRLLKRCYHRRSYRGRLLWVAPTEGPIEAQNMIFTFNRICPNPLFKTLTFICFSSILQSLYGTLTFMFSFLEISFPHCKENRFLHFIKIHGLGNDFSIVLCNFLYISITFLF